MRRAWAVLVEAFARLLTRAVQTSWPGAAARLPFAADEDEEAFVAGTVGADAVGAGGEAGGGEAAFEAYIVADGPDGEGAPGLERVSWQLPVRPGRTASHCALREGIGAVI